MSCFVRVVTLREIRYVGAGIVAVIHRYDETFWTPGRLGDTWGALCVSRLCFCTAYARIASATH